MREDRPSKTAYKVALNVLTLGAKPGMDEVLPPGIVDATEKLLIAFPAQLAQELYDGPVPDEWSLSTRRSTGCCRVSLRPLATERLFVSAR